MLLFKNNGFHQKYAYGGANIFTTLANLFRRFVTSTATKQIARNIRQRALSVGKTAAKELGRQAFDTGLVAERSRKA